ncbi:MAG: hypothetical protein KDK70_04945 [Myxococcales bacterium]|nr:hypothetical protein [Myxococcales bacterium]
MDDDLPAAHSMDTTWYAVDEHGHVGVFDTGEDGALPVDAATGMSPVDPNFDVALLELTQLATLLERGDDPMAGRESWIVAGRTVVVVDPPAGDADPPAPPAWVQEAIDEDELELVRPGPPLLLLSRRALDEPQVRALSEREGVRWTIPLVDVGELTNTGEPPDGFFRFGRDHGDDPGRYVCSRMPEDPVHVDALEPELAAALSRLRLPVDFRSHEPVHLADYEGIYAHTWGDLPLRYTEGWQEEQRARRAGLTEQQQRTRGMVVLVVMIGLLALVFGLRCR